MEEENKAVDTEQQTEQTEEQARVTESNEQDVKSEAQKIADAMLAKKLKGMPSKEELKAFKEWQESQKTEEQKQSDAISAAEQAKLAAEQRAAAAEAKTACLIEGIAADYVDDAIVLAQRLVNDDMDINAAIKKIAEKYPAFKGQAQPTITITTGTKSSKQTGNGNDAARAVMGLPPEK